jgi:hypothetical protein
MWGGHQTSDIYDFFMHGLRIFMLLFMHGLRIFMLLFMHSLMNVCVEDI